MKLEDPQNGRCDICVIAGEHSGDEHAALLAGDLWKESPDLQICAVGGLKLQSVGVQLLHDLTENSVVGVVEVLRNYGYFRQLFAAILEWLEKWRPRVLVLVDYPGFNLRLAQALRARGLSRKGGGKMAIYQYVSPQIWAWKGGRRFKMAKTLDEVGAIFPFEVDCYSDTSLDVHFVGHPFAREDYRPPVSYAPNGKLLLLPGSRLQAVSRIFPAMLRACAEMECKEGVTVLYPGEGVKEQLERDLEIHRPKGVKIELLPVAQGAAAGAVMTSSGTMSLICALVGIPGAIVYRAHPLTYYLGKRLVKIPYLGMANLILGEAMYPEFIQGETRPELLAACVGRAREQQVIDECLLNSQKLNEALRAPHGYTAAQRIAHLL
jgi:lipid-A-disaccharide synthase